MGTEEPGKPERGEEELLSRGPLESQNTEFCALPS